MFHLNERSMMVAKKKILVADNDPAIAEITRFVLEETGRYEVKVTRPAALADQLHTSVPDLILLDYLMKGLYADLPWRQLRDRPETKDLPLILFSTYPEVQEVFKEAGAMDFILKPFELDVLLHKVERVFQPGVASQV